MITPGTFPIIFGPTGAGFMTETRCCRAQALAEFVVCLVPFLFVFSGILLLAVYGRENLLCTLSARSRIELDSAGGTLLAGGGTAPRNIREWNYGADRIPHTSDDTAVLTSSETALRSELYTSENTIFSGTDSAGKVWNVTFSPDKSLSVDDLIDAGYVTTPAGRSAFLDAANLNSRTVKADNVLQKYGMNSLSLLFQMYLRNDSISLRDTVFMPARRE